MSIATRASALNCVSQTSGGLLCRGFARFKLIRFAIQDRSRLPKPDLFIVVGGGLIRALTPIARPVAQVCRRKSVRHPLRSPVAVNLSL